MYIDLRFDYLKRTVVPQRLPTYPEVGNQVAIHVVLYYPNRLKTSVLEYDVNTDVIIRITLTTGIGIRYTYQINQ